MSEMLSQGRGASQDADGDTHLVRAPDAVDHLHHLLMQCVVCFVFTAMVLFLSYFLGK